MVDIRAGIEITAAVEGLANIKNLLKEIEAAGVDTSALSTEFEQLTQQWQRTASEQALITSFKAIKKEFGETNTEINHTKQQMAALQQQMATNGGGTDEQKQKYKELEEKLKSLNEHKKKLGEQLKTVRDGMNAAGISTNNLAQHERRLAQEAADAQKEMERLTKEAEELKAIADARIELGLDTDDKARAEIKRITEAYERLRDSGTLTQEELARATELHNRRVRELESSLQSAKPSLADIANGLQGIVGQAGGLALVAREAIAFESAMAGVKKVVDGTPEQISELEAEIKSLAGTLGILPVELANIAAQGGQLGIALDKLPEFTKMAASMSVAFGISAEAAGDAAAKIANVYQLPIDKVGELGDAINVLGNNTAAKEKDIVEVMTRIGGNAKQFGLAAEEAAALADAFIALGKPPEVAGTAINALLSKLQTAQSQTPGFKDALQSIGLSADDMAASIAANPQKALTAFLKQLETLDTQARSLVLAEMFGAEFSDDVAVLVGSLGEYEKALALVADKSQTLGAMQKEVDAALDTTQAKINQAKASFASTASTLGQVLLPIMGSVSKAAHGVSDAIGYIATNFPTLTQLAVALTAAKVGMMAFQTVATMTGTTAVGSMMRTKISVDSITAALGRARMQAAAFASQMQRANGGRLGIITAQAGMLGGALGTAAQGAFALGAAFTAGFAVGDFLYEKFEWVRTVGDELGRMVAYVDAIFSKERTFDDVRQFYKTSKEEEQEAIKRKKELEEADKKRAEASKQAAVEETARIQAMQQEYRLLKNEHANVISSMKTLAAAGLVNGAAYQDLTAKAAEYQEQLKKLQEKINKAGEAFAYDDGPIAKAKVALKDLGLTVGQVQTGISEGASKALEDFDKAAVQFGTGSEQMGRIFANALQKMDSPEAIEALRERLGKVSKQAGLTADDIKKIGDTAPDAASRVADAFAKIGVDVAAINKGISKEAEEAFKGFADATQMAREEGQHNAKIIRASFEAIFEKLKSKQEFEAFKQQLKATGNEASLTQEQLKRLNDAAQEGASVAKTRYEELTETLKKAANAADLSAVSAAAKTAMDNGTISAAQYDEILGQVKARTEELKTASATMGDSAAQAHNKAAQAASTNTDAVKKQSEAVKESGKALEQAGNSSLQTFKRISFNFHNYLTMTQEQIAAMRQSMKELPTLLGGGILGALKGFADRVKAYKAGVDNAVKATEELNEATNNGTVSMELISRATAAATLSWGKLDKVTLSNLHAAIDKARAKLASMRQEASDTVASLEADLASLRGDDSRREALEQEKKLRELNAKLAQAEAQRNGEAATQYRQAISLQNQIFAEQQRQKQVAANQAAANQAAAEQANQSRSQQSRKIALDLPDIDIGDGAAASASQLASVLRQHLDGRDQKVASQAVNTLVQQLTKELKAER